MDGEPARAKEIAAVKGIYEIGRLEFIWFLMSYVIGTIMKIFFDYFMKIIALRLNRIINPIPP